MKKRKPAFVLAFFIVFSYLYERISMANVVDPVRSPYGLSGGSIFSGSVQAVCDGYWYYPVTATTAEIVLNNLSGSRISASFTPGNGVYGDISQVTQSVGIAVVYSASAPIIRYS